MMVSAIARHQMRPDLATVVAGVNDALRPGCDPDEVASRAGAMFEALKETLSGDRREEGWDDLARELGMTPGALKVAAHRLRRRYREVVRRTVADTVGDDSVDDEIQFLLRAIA